MTDTVKNRSLWFRREPGNIFNFHYICRLPSNLDIDKLLLEYRFKVGRYSSDPQKIRDRLAFIVNAIVVSYHSQKEKGKIQKKDCFIPLCSEILRAGVRDYNLYLKFLVEANVIEFGSQEIADGKCYKYRFCKPYNINRLRKYFILDKGYLKSLYRHRRDSEAINRYRRQYEHLVRLTVCWEEALDILSKKYNKDEFRKIEGHLERLEAIIDPEKATYKIGETNRLYNTLCNLLEELRSCLRYEGKPLVELDIKNSIPFFTLALFSHTLHKQGLDNKLCSINPQLMDSMGKLSHWLILVDSAREPDKYPDIQDFTADVKSGKIYEELAKAWNLLIDGRIYDRNRAKKKLLAIFNSPSFYESKERRIFKVMYPNVLQAIEEINNGFTRTKNGNGNGRWKPGDQVCTFAHITQMFEARVVLDVVCKSIETEKPEIPILTLHDCILTIPEHVETVKEYMLNKITEIMGFAPIITVKDNGTCDLN